MMHITQTTQDFDLQSSFEPSGDQPQAIKDIIAGFDRWEPCVTLLWATGTGKTFTMAQIIKKYNKPTLVLSHNKTLAAQLATEFKHFFPNNAVHYFVSYFDYYQPESYLAAKDVYIEKEATVNQEIEMYRLSTMASLLTRNDVIVVSSVSALYGLGAKEEYANHTAFFVVGEKYNFKDIKRQLITMQYEPVNQKVEPGMFDMRWEMIDIHSSIERVIYRLMFNESILEAIEKKDATTYESLWTLQKVVIWPSTQYIQDLSNLENILKQIEAEMEDRSAEFEKQWRLIEAQRIKKRVLYDIRMIKETWFVNGIENYWPYFERRQPWQTPNSIFDYFPDDVLVLVDESHMTIWQFRGMPNADRTRKVSLIDHGFRLPSAIDHRPLNFEELETILRRSDTWKQPDWLTSKVKKKSKTIYVSATPAAYELEHTKTIAEQIIRPTWLLDPVTYIYPLSWDYSLLVKSFDKLLKKKPHLTSFLQSYDSHSPKDVFEWTIPEVELE